MYQKLTSDTERPNSGYYTRQFEKPKEDLLWEFSARNSTCFFCIECHSQWGGFVPALFLPVVTNGRLISYWTIKDATGGGGRGRGGRRREAGRAEDEKEGREAKAKKKKKFFYPARRQKTFSISSNRVLVSLSRVLRPSSSTHLSVATNFDSCLCDSPSSLSSPPDLVQPRVYSTLLRANFPSFDIPLSVPFAPAGKRHLASLSMRISTHRRR